MLVVAAFESRDQTGSILRMETFDNNVVNVTILIEVVLAILIARGGVLTSLLGTQALTGRQWLIGGALPALLLFILWELGKLIARRASRRCAGGDTRRGDARRGSRRMTNGPRGHDFIRERRSGLGQTTASGADGGPWNGASFRSPLDPSKHGGLNEEIST